MASFFRPENLGLRRQGIVYGKPALWQGWDGQKHTGWSLFWLPGVPRDLKPQDIWDVIPPAQQTSTFWDVNRSLTFQESLKPRVFVLRIFQTQNPIPKWIASLFLRWIRASTSGSPWGTFVPSRKSVWGASAARYVSWTPTGWLRQWFQFFEFHQGFICGFPEMGDPKIIQNGLLPMGKPRVWGTHIFWPSRYVEIEVKLT